MKVIENRLIGENTFENAVLRNVIENALCAIGHREDLREAAVSDPGEAGIMSAEAEWTYGSLEFETWIEVGSYYGEPDPQHFAWGEFHLLFKWRTPEREGLLYELEDIVQWDDDEPLEVAEPSCGLRLFTA